jgi:hypothetical protein
VATAGVAVTIPRLTLENILDLLKNEVPQARIAKLVSERGITFAVSPEAEGALAAAGAERPLIESVKNAPR